MFASLIWSDVKPVAFSSALNCHAALFEARINC